MALARDFASRAVRVLDPGTIGLSVPELRIAFIGTNGQVKAYSSREFGVMMEAHANPVFVLWPGFGGHVSVDHVVYNLRFR